MSNKYVLDSSVIAAIFFREKSSQEAAEKVRYSQLVTVDLARAEVANVAWKRVNIFHEAPELIIDALKMSMEFINNSCDVIPTGKLVDESFQIAVKEKVSFYDALFLAAAKRENIPLLTLDRQLAKSSNLVEIL